MIPFGLTSLMTVSMPIGRRATKCFVPGASAIYLMNEGSGTTLTDRSGNDHHGTLGADAAAPTWGPTGLTFDGGDVVNCGTWRASSADGSELSVVAVITPDTQATTRGIVAQYNTTGNQRAWALLASDTYFRVIISDDGTSTGHLKDYRTASGTVTPGAAQLVGFTFDHGTLKIYIGGVEVAVTKSVDDAISTVYNPATPVVIGTYSGTNYYDGDAHVVGIWPRALSPTEWQQNLASAVALVVPRGIDINL